MFPLFSLFNEAIVIYTFGLTLTLCFFLFLWMLKKLSTRFSYDFSFFLKNILYFFLSTFLFSRLFHVLANWNTLKYIKDPLQFFIMSDYNFSLFGAMLGFAGTLYFLLKDKKDQIVRYADGVVLAFLFVLVVGYTGALLGGQVYGRQTNIGIELLYSHPFTPVPFQVPIFPLPLVYAIVFFLLFSILYILSTFVRIRGFIASVGMLAFSAILLVFESLSGKSDILSQTFFLNINQILSIVLMSFVGYHFYRLIQKNAGEKGVTILSHKE